MKFSLFVLLLSCFHPSSFGAVILQYHHVSDTTPSSTSISPQQFEIHMQYLADNNFNVVALSDLMNSIKNNILIVSGRHALWKFYPVGKMRVQLFFRVFIFP